MKILSGTSNLQLSKDISKILKLKLVNTNIKRFSDGEIYIEINENIRGNSVFVVQSTSNPANDNLMELLFIIDALKKRCCLLTCFSAVVFWSQLDYKSSCRNWSSA